MNDPEYIRDVLQTFVTHMPGQLQELWEATVKKDFAGIYYLSHKLKGSVGMLQSIELHNLLSRIEEQAKKRIDTTAMTQAVITMYDELEMNLKAELVKYPNDEDTGSRR